MKLNDESARDPPGLSPKNAIAVMACRQLKVEPLVELKVEPLVELKVEPLVELKVEPQNVASRRAHSRI